MVSTTCASVIDRPLRTARGQAPSRSLIWLNTQKRASVTTNFLIESALKAVEGDRKDLDVAKLTGDQLYVYAILGDPAMKLRLPAPLEAAFTQVGDTVNWSAQKPRGATRLYVSFLPADRKMPRLEPLKDRKTALDRFEEANAAGEPLPQVEWYQGANPSVPEVFDKALAKFKNAVDTHPGLDGMWTDFIRWPIHWEVRDWEEGIDPYIYDTSFDAATLTRFEEATGIDIPDDLATAPEQAQWIYDTVHDEWGQWKCSIINKFCEEAHAYLKSKDPDKVLGAFTVPWKVSDYDGAILKIVGQDYAAMSEWVEVWSPMTYYDMMDYSTEWIGEFTTYCKQVTGRPTIPIIMGFSISLDKYGDELTPEELYDSIMTTATAEGSDGVMMFWYNSILDTERLDEVVEAYAELP